MPRGNWTPNVCRHCGVALTPDNWPASTQRQQHKQCHECGKAAARRYFAAHHKERVEYQHRYYHTRLKGRYAARRAEAIAAYGRRCACCGESRIEFLAIDHIAGGGSRERKARGGNRAYAIYDTLKAQGWPTGGHRLLCSNCNYSSWAHSGCPHEREPFPTSFPWAIPTAA